MGVILSLLLLLLITLLGFLIFKGDYHVGSNSEMDNYNRYLMEQDIKRQMYESKINKEISSYDEIDFNKVEKVFFGCSLFKVNFFDKVEITYKNGDFAVVEPKHLYPISVPEEDVFLKIRADKEGNPIKEKGLYKKIKKEYEGTPVKCIRQDGFIFCLKKDSDWDKKDSEKRKKVWEEFKNRIEEEHADKVEIQK